MESTPATTTPAAHRRSGGRIAAIIIGVLLSLIALGVALAGAGLVITRAVFDRDGFVTSPPAHVSTDTYALVSEPFDAANVDEWPFGDGPIRLRALLEDTDKPMFVGFARAEDVDRALAGVGHATVTRVSDRRVSDVSYDVSRGGPPARPPAQLITWDAQASGTGDVAATWSAHPGKWVIVAMNADGSAGVRGDARMGADIPGLGGLAWGLLALGVLLGGIAAALIIYGAGGLGGGAGPAPDRAIEPAPGSTAVAASGPGGALPPAAPALPPRTVRVEARLTSPAGRWLWIVKWLLLVPHYIVLALLFAAFVICTIVAWFAIVFTARYPRGLFHFNAGVLRWSWRVSGYSYGAMATDRYPPFTLGEAPDYPVRLEIERAERMSRGLPFVKWALAAPHLLLVGAATGGVAFGTGSGRDESFALGLAGLLALFIGLALLFTGRLPRGLFDLLVGIQRWGLRTAAYVALLTDEYPPFRLDPGPLEPGGVSAPEPAAPAAPLTPGA